MSPRPVCPHRCWRPGARRSFETLGGIALIAGFRTRITALALAGFSVMAAVFFHAQFADQNQMIHFLKNLAIADGLLQLAAFGPGRFAFNR